MKEFIRIQELIRIQKNLFGCEEIYFNIMKFIQIQARAELCQAQVTQGLVVLCEPNKPI